MAVPAARVADGQAQLRPPSSSRTAPSADQVAATSSAPPLTSCRRFLPPSPSPLLSSCRLALSVPPGRPHRAVSSTQERQGEERPPEALDAPPLLRQLQVLDWITYFGHFAGAIFLETPLLLDVNTKATKLREVIDKIIKIKLGMNLPLVMIGSTLVSEDGDGLEEDEAANCALNLENVLVELPAPVINGTKLTVEDLRQELSCSINIKHREEFDKEKEPDRMVLYGWPAPVEEQINSNGEKKSTTSSSCAHVTDNTTEDTSSKPGMKRKLGELLKTKENCDASSSA